MKHREGVIATEAKLLIVQFLDWVAARPRTLTETRNVWSSTCPLNCAWEDALTDDLVDCRADGRVALSARGQAHLAAARQLAATTP